MNGQPARSHALSVAAPWNQSIITTFYGEEQLVVQSREELAGLNPTTGKVLWSEKIPAYRGMNILTPMPYGNAIFTSTYGGKAWLYDIIKNADESFTVQQRWQNKVQGYMSSPVIVGEHVYLHLRNRRFICINLETGKETFTTKPFGEYWSMIARDNRILALDEKGELLLIEANPKAFTLIDRAKVSDQPAWAHLAKNGGELFIRDMNSLRRFQWETPTSAQ